MTIIYQETLVRTGTAPGNGDMLSAKEIDCLRWAAQGKTAHETGLILGISRRTVEQHLGAAAGKLRANNRTHAVALAMASRTITLDIQP